MTIQEFYGQFILESKRASYLEERYDEMLKRQLLQWTQDSTAHERIIKAAIRIFCERITEFEIENDCYDAIVDCMREVLFKELRSGSISGKHCCKLLRLWTEKGIQIKNIPTKQMNLVLSDFTREMFDYYIERYYYMKNVAVNSKLEKKLSQIFRGNGNITAAFVMHGYRPLDCSTEAYLVYAESISPYFLQQIGGKKSIDAHIDALAYGRARRIARRSQRLFPFVVILLVVLCIMWMLSMQGIIPW